MSHYLTATKTKYSMWRLAAIPVHHVVLGLVVMVVLSSCGGTLPLNTSRSNGPNILPTATRGVPAQTALPLSSDNPLSPFSTPAPIPLDPTSSIAPDQATTTSEPPVASEPTVAATTTVIPELGGVALPLPANLQDRWRAQQVERAALPVQATYVTPSYQVVRWFDPVTGQYVTIGELRGEFTVQATFRIKGDWFGALEVPFNAESKNYGIAVPAAIVQRIKAVDPSGWCEVFVYQTQDIQPK